MRQIRSAVSAYVGESTASTPLAVIVAMKSRLRMCPAKGPRPWDEEPSTFRGAVRCIGGPLGVNRYRVPRAASLAMSAMPRKRSDWRTAIGLRAALKAKSSQRPLEKSHGAISENLARTAYHVARGETVTPWLEL